MDADDFLWKYYSEINSYERCVLGEAYGYDSSYAVAGSKNRCQMCGELSGNFSFQIRLLDKKKIEMTINKFTIHWNEKHKIQVHKNSVHSITLNDRHSFLHLAITIVIR